MCYPPTAVPTLQHNNRLQAQWAYCDNPAPLQSQWTTPFTMPASAAVNHMQAVTAADTQGQNQGTEGPISALWEWDQDENHHQAQLDISTQFGPNPPGSTGADSRQTDRQTDGRTDILFYYILYKLYNILLEDTMHRQCVYFPQQQCHTKIQQ